MRKRISLSTSLALIFISIALSVSLTMIFAMKKFSATVNEVSKRQAMYDYLTEVDKSVRQNYSGTIDEVVLQEDLATAYMKAIGDPYADYLTTDEYADYKTQNSGSKDGYGITLAQVGLNNKITVVSVDEGSPAAIAGIKIGDELISIDEKEYSNTSIDLYTANSILKDTSKTLITLSREGKKQSYNLSSALYSIVSVETKEIDSMGYIRIKEFNEQTAEQFYKAIDKLIDKHVIAFIFDLRDNQGGSLDIAAEMTGYLVPKGTFANNTSSDGTVTPITSTSPYEMGLPAVVLVNGKTAGEAELFAGALQECTTAKVLGEKTAGRSKVQGYYPISSDNAAIKLSVSELSLAKRGSWELIGIIPDQEVKAETGYVNVDMLDEKTDVQLNEATAYLQKLLTNPETVMTTTTSKATTTKKTKTTTTTESD